MTRPSTPVQATPKQRLETIGSQYLTVAIRNLKNARESIENQLREMDMEIALLERVQNELNNDLIKKL